jgi:hypothetical protein
MYYFKIGLTFLAAVLLPFYVFPHTGTELTLTKIAYVWENSHKVDVIGLVQRHSFAILASVSLWVNIFNILWLIPIIDWIKSRN